MTIRLSDSSCCENNNNNNNPPPLLPQTNEPSLVWRLHGSNLSPRRLLLTGPPACGKTTWLMHLAVELLVNSDKCTAACCRQKQQEEESCTCGVVVICKRQYTTTANDDDNNDDDDDFPLFLRRAASNHNDTTFPHYYEDDDDWNPDVLQRIHVYHYATDADLQLFLWTLQGGSSSSGTYATTSCRGLLVDDLDASRHGMLLALVADTAAWLQVPVVVVAAVSHGGSKNATAQALSFASRFFNATWTLAWNETNESGHIVSSSSSSSSAAAAGGDDEVVAEYRRVGRCYEWNLPTTTTSTASY